MDGKWDMETTVARGAAWLDRVEPGWRDLVDTDALDMTSSTMCVAGQVFDSLMIDGYSRMQQLAAQDRSLTLQRGTASDAWLRIDEWLGFTAHPEGSSLDSPYHRPAEEANADPLIAALRERWTREVKGQ